MNHGQIEACDPRAGDWVTYWTAGEDAHGRPVWLGNCAMVASTHVLGPPYERGPRTSERAADAYLFVVFSARTGIGGGCGNRYVRAEDWGHLGEGCVTVPDSMSQLGNEMRPRIDAHPTASVASVLDGRTCSYCGHPKHSAACQMAHP